MGKHGSRYRDSYVQRDDRNPMMAGGPVDYDARPRLPRKLSMTVAFVVLVLWSLLAWAGYALVDPVLDWIAANVGLLVDGGKDLATATGVGNEAGSLIDSLGGSGFWEQANALLRAIVKPAIVVVWAIGALVIIAAPVILQKVGRLLGARRH